MTALLDDMERALADLMLSGFSSGANMPERFRHLAADCENRGLHTGASLMGSVAAGLQERSHSIQKEDLTLTANICRAVRYVELCREKLLESQIRTRWDGITGGKA